MIKRQSQSRRAGDAQPYGLAGPSLAGPPLPGEVFVAQTIDQLLDLLAAELVAQAMVCQRRFGDFELALSGGSTPQPLYDRLMYDPNCRQLPWARTHLWLVDERGVSLDDDRSNFRMINETIVKHSGIPPEQVHPIDALSETADVDYEAQLREVLQWRQRGQDRLDFVLLGMGQDGHTASLFPHNDVLGERHRLMRRVDEPAAEPPDRVTMTFPLINSARMVAILVTGASKADTISRIAKGDMSVEQMPVTGVRPEQGVLKWFLDAEACAAVERPTGKGPSS
jgi:6-phosphogluconolactonase